MTAFLPVDGGKAVFFARRGMDVREVQFRCGQCIGCRLDKARQWSIRCLHESQMHERSSFVTLTYDEEHVPRDGGLDYRHFQLFLKRLRKQCLVRFFMAGEYGERTKRPHYHACLFGVGFDDRVLLRAGSPGLELYSSKRLEALWPLGASSVGEVTLESAGYVARYTAKKVTGEAAELAYSRVDPDTGEYFQVSPEFGHMSLKPGIGATWFEKFGREVWTRDAVVVQDGVKLRPPRHYDQLLARDDDDLSQAIKLQRYIKSFELEADNSYDRLAVQERCATARYALKARSLD